MAVLGPQLLLGPRVGRGVDKHVLHSHVCVPSFTLSGPSTFPPPHPENRDPSHFCPERQALPRGVWAAEVIPASRFWPLGHTQVLPLRTPRELALPRGPCSGISGATKKGKLGDLTDR